MKCVRNRTVVGRVSLHCFDCCETEGEGGHPREKEEDVDERGGGGKIVRWTEERLRVRTKGAAERTVQEDNTPRLLFPHGEIKFTDSL